MSAWIVGRAHIDVLVQALAESETVTSVTPDLIGRVLWAENLASVAYRYPDDGDGDRPGPVDFRDADVQTYIYRRPANKPELLPLRVALGCYRYQSCEHPGWRDSLAAAWIGALDDALARAGVREPRAGEHMEAWGYEEEDVHGQPAAVG